MKLPSLLLITIFLITSCKSQSAGPTVVPTTLPSETPAATATISPTATPSPIPTPSDVFGAIPLNSVQAFSIEPVAKAIFDQTLQGYIMAGTIQEYRVDSVAVFPSGEGGLIAEIMYGLRADYDLWPDDFGTAGVDNWTNGKCSRFDLVTTDTEHQLKNKRLCS